MASPPPNPDSRQLPYGWIQQYNWDYRQWYYVNTRENPPRSVWEHPLGPMTQGFAAPTGPPPNQLPYGQPGPPPPPPDRSFNRSPYDGPPQGYGGYGSSYNNNAPAGGYLGNSSYPGNRAYSPGAQREVVYVEGQPQQRRGPGIGTAVAAGAAGMVGGALLTKAFENHDEREREQGFEQGFQDGYDDRQMNQAGNDDGDDGGFF